MKRPTEPIEDGNQIYMPGEKNYEAAWFEIMDDGRVCISFEHSHTYISKESAKAGIDFLNRKLNLNATDN